MPPGFTYPIDPLDNDRLLVGLYYFRLSGVSEVRNVNPSAQRMCCRIPLARFILA